MVREVYSALSSSSESGGKEGNVCGHGHNHGQGGVLCTVLLIRVWRTTSHNGGNGHGHGHREVGFLRTVLFVSVSTRGGEDTPALH